MLPRVFLFTCEHFQLTFNEIRFCSSHYFAFYVQLLTFLAAKCSIPRDIWNAKDIKSLIVTEGGRHSVSLVDFVFMMDGLLPRKNSRRLP